MVDRGPNTEELAEKSVKDLFYMIPERVWPGSSRATIKVVAGCMYSGKTTELINDIRRAGFANQGACIFKPSLDNRYEGITKVNSHDGGVGDAIPVTSAKQILTEIISSKRLGSLLVVGIDEIQFFDSEIVDVAVGLRGKGFRVVAAGLNLDFRGEPFGPMPQILVHAEEIIRTHAICNECGGQADYTQRIVDGVPANYDNPIILIGAQDSYEARCYEHHIVPGKPRIVPRPDEL